jgi:dihydroorotate dehydrogenase electron transfer subunit
MELQHSRKICLTCQGGGSGFGNVMKLFQARVPILYNVKVGPVYFRMGLAFAEVAQKARPGQFVMVKPHEGPIPILRRPFSIHSRIVENGRIRGFELLYKVVGQATGAMSEMKAGDVLDVLGPLGNGFSLYEDRRDVYLVAGGVGVASLYYLGLCLQEHGTLKFTVFLGGCSASDILCQEGFKSMGADVCISTEDCSLGERGVVTSLVEKALQGDGKPDVIYACGPHAMLKAVSDIGAAHGVECQISLETAMACGFGVCLGCAVEKAGDPGAYLHACTDGPVFDSRAVRI